MSKYKDLISRDDKKVKADEIDFIVEKAKLQIQSDIIAAKRVLNNAKGEMDKAASATPFIPSSYINAKRTFADAEQDIKDLESLQKELF